jgi:hypothetical protein
MLPTTTDRVRRNTAPTANDDIERSTRDAIWRHVADGEAGIERRLAQLDREWDIERVLEANAAGAVLAGVALGATVNRRLFLLPLLVGSFLLQHALQGWCPPLPVLRRLGVRTQSEIESERYALKAIRGDFNDLSSRSGREAAPVEAALEAVHL